MRALFVLAALAALAQSAEAGLWTAACNDGKDFQYQQIIGDEGHIHLGNGNGSYATVKVKQSYYDGKTVCGSVDAKAGPGEIAAACADNEQQVIRVISGAQRAKGLHPEKVPAYCRALVSAN